MSEQIDIGLRVLDHQVLDCDGRRCGKVDDLAVEGGPGEQAEVAALFVGRRRPVRIPWSEVADVNSGVQLRGRAEEYGLGRGDDFLRPWIERVPGANR
jgi:sporulation protein YlmC with PRC-barrel domain